MNEIEPFLSAYGLPAIFVILLIKAIGVPIPIPSDVIMLTAAARVAQGKLALGVTFVVILAALLIGGVLQFVIARSAGRGITSRAGRYMGLTPARLDAAAAVVKKGGPLGIGVAILTPGVRSAAIIACGVAAISLRTFSAGLLIGSVAFLSLHFLIGYLGGPLIASLTQNIPLPLIVAGFVTLLLIGFGVWLMIRRRQQPGASSRTIAVDAFEAFHEASCPVCLTLGAISHIRPATANLPHVHADG